MRIENRFINSKDRLKKDKTTEKGDHGFIGALQSLETSPEVFVFPDEMKKEDFQNLAGLIEQIGESLSNNPTPENFNQYKKHIKLFINLLQENYEVKDTLSRISFSKQKLYKTIETIDSGLAEMAQLILSNEKNRLSYLKLVNSIKGLIIDLIL